MAFKLKHKGAAALMQSLSAMPKPVRKMPVQKAPVKKDPDPKDKRAKSSSGLFDDMSAAERYKAMKAYREADELTRSRMSKEFKAKQLKDYEKTGGDEAYNQLQKSFRESKAKYTAKYGDPSEPGISAKERLTRTEAINANAAKDVGMAYPRAGIKASAETQKTLERYNAEAERLGKIYDLAMQGRSYDKYKKQPTETAGAAPKKIAGVGTKSIKERIYEDGRKKKKANTAKRATMTKKMYKR